MRGGQKLFNSSTMKKLAIARTLACFILAVILSTDLYYVRDEVISGVVTDIVTGHKQHDSIKIINLTSSEVSLLDVTAETIKQIQIGERVEIYNSFILFRTVSIERQYYSISQRILPGNVLIFALNIFAIVGFIDGLINIILIFYRSKTA